MAFESSRLTCGVWSSTWPDPAISACRQMDGGSVANVIATCATCIAWRQLLVDLKVL